MKRLFLAALLALLSGLLLAGCGGGSKSARSTHSAVTVTLKIALPPTTTSKQVGKLNLSAGRSPGSQAKRLIPAGATRYTVLYSAVDAVTGNVIPNKTTPLANIPTITDPTNPSFNVTIPDFQAGVSNMILVTLYDATNNGLGNPTTIVANGSTQVNLAPGQTVNPASPINITLQSTVTGLLSFTIDGIPVNTGNAAPGIGPGTHTVSVAIQNSANVLVQSIGAQLKWTATGGINIVGASTGYTINVQRVTNGAASLTVTYSETINNNGTSGTAQIRTATLPLTIQTPSQNLALIQNSTPANLTVGSPIGNPYDVADNGFTLLYDAARFNPPIDNVGSGYSRFEQLALPGLVQTSVFDFDTAATPTYVGAGSRATYFTSSGTNYAAVTNGGGTQITAFAANPASTQRGASVFFWRYATAPATTTILDVDAKGSFVYLLEQVSLGVYQIEILNQATGLKLATNGTIALTGLGFTPTNLAVVLPPAVPTETDYYLTGTASISVAKVVGATAPAFAAIAPPAGTILDIATSANPNVAYVLTTNGITELATADGSLVAATALTGAAAGLRLSCSGTSVYALENNAGSAQIEGFLLP